MFSIFWPFKFFSALANMIINLIILATCIFTVTGFFGGAGWLLDLTSHFRLQYLVVQILALVVSMVVLKLQKKSKAEWLGTLVFLGVFVILNASQVLPLLVGKPFADGSHRGGRLKILQMNVFVYSKNWDAVSAAIRQSDADVVSLQEISQEWLQHLTASGALNKYPYTAVQLESGNGLFSKRPLANVRLDPLEREPEGLQRLFFKSGVIRADVNAGGKTVTLVSLHPPVPVVAFADTYQKYLNYFIGYAPQLKRHPLILVGDLNTTPWSHYYRRYIELLDLKDARSGFGLVPSWPSIFPPLHIPIDQILVSKEIETIEIKTLSNNGSDHLPLFVELELN